MGEDTHLSLLQDKYPQLAWFFGFPGAVLWLLSLLSCVGPVVVAP